MITCAGECCWHFYVGAIWMVVPEGHVVEQCCACGASRTVHREHHGIDKNHVPKSWWRELRTRYSF